MRVRTAEQVARRAVIVRRFIRAVPRRQCIKVDLFWLCVYGFVSGLVGIGLTLPLVFAVVQWALTRPH